MSLDSRGESPAFQAKLKHDSKRFRVFCVILVVLVMSALMHLHHWNQHFFSIFPLKTAQILGMASESELMQLAEICKSRAKSSCQIRIYQEILKSDSQNVSVLEKLAEVQYLSGRHREAAMTLHNFFTQGGKSVRAAYIYAKTLEALRRPSEAAEYYEKAIELKPYVLQVSVSEDYVKLMIKNGQFKEAKDFIDRLRRMGAPKSFLVEEYAKASQNMDSKT